MRNYFKKVFVITLARRPDRWDAFKRRIPSDWPFGQIERVNAIDGKKCRHPVGWRQGGGAWGCYRTHLRLIEDCLNNDIESVLLLEDDCTFIEGFATQAQTFLREVPDDWGMLYLGGQHLHAKKSPPIRISDRVYKPYNVNRTHAWALRQPLMQKVYRWLCTADWRNGHHIDHHLGRFHMRREDPIYTPDTWLCGQAEGRSNISGRDHVERLWPAAELLNNKHGSLPPFVAVLSLHASGSSCVAGVLYHLGVHMGNKLTGYHGSPPINGGEAIGLVQLCNTVIPKFSTEVLRPSTFGSWSQARRREARDKRTIAGGKFPTLLALTDDLRALGDDLRVLYVDRPFLDSVSSIRKRPDLQSKDLDAIERQQQWLRLKRDDLYPHVKHWLNVQFYQLLKHPIREIQRIIDFLQLSPTPEQVQAAVNYVKPELQHECVDVLGRADEPGNQQVLDNVQAMVPRRAGVHGERLA